MSVLLCLTSAWHRGRAKTRAAVLPDRTARPGCVHELPAFAVTEEALRKICRLHERALPHGRTRCPLDVTAALLRHARERGLPVRVETEPPGLAQGLAFASGASLEDVLKGLHAAAPGTWLLFAPGLDAPLQPSRRLVKDVVPPTGGEFLVRAVRREPKRKTDNANRIQALKRLACPSGGGTEAERLRALQKLELELRKL
jgi:hypothetical protein